ncbi:hypothetical protein AB0H81_40735, partial [Nonomuraea sp. NPDC050691]
METRDTARTTDPVHDTDIAGPATAADVAGSVTRADVAGSATDARLMARAVELAARGHGTTSPNPVVGCVILDAAGQVAGERRRNDLARPARLVVLRLRGLQAPGGPGLGDGP